MYTATLIDRQYTKKKKGKTLNLTKINTVKCLCTSNTQLQQVNFRRIFIARFVNWKWKYEWLFSSTNNFYLLNICFQEKKINVIMAYLNFIDYKHCGFVGWSIKSLLLKLPSIWSMYIYVNTFLHYYTLYSIQYMYVRTYTRLQCFSSTR